MGLDCSHHRGVCVCVCMCARGGGKDGLMINKDTGPLLDTLSLSVWDASGFTNLLQSLVCSVGAYSTQRKVRCRVSGFGFY